MVVGSQGANAGAGRERVVCEIARFPEPVVLTLTHELTARNMAPEGNGGCHSTSQEDCPIAGQNIVLMTPQTASYGERRSP